MRKGEIIRMFDEYVRRQITADGWEMPAMMSVTPNGTLELAAMAFAGPDAHVQIMACARSAIDAGSTELIFGLDRFAGEGQGTTLPSLVTVDYFDGRAWRFGTIEYSFDPWMVKSPAWDNSFWIKQQIVELSAFFRPLPVHAANRAPIVPPPLGKQPADVTEAKKAHWRTILTSAPIVADLTAADSAWSLLWPGYFAPPLETRFFAGEWLEEQLAAAGADLQTIHRICFAHGQRVALNRDPWGTAFEVLDRFRRGDTDYPEIQFSQRLYREAMPYFLEMYGPPRAESFSDLARLIGDRGPVIPEI